MLDPICLYWFLKKCVVCINVPIHVYDAAVGEIEIFHSRVMGKKVFTNIVWMLTTGVSCALGAAVYFVYSLFLLYSHLLAGFWFGLTSFWIITMHKIRRYFWWTHETFGTKIYIAPCEKIINSLNTKALSIYQYVCPNKLSLSKVPLILLLIVKLLQPMLQMLQIFGFCREKWLSNISFFISFFTYFNDVHVM